ncbi:site-specific integrase [Ornithinimicrobium faecis]|uniref:Site-specific integrase n=1 Tax=Ornithinimicrobium faecis TaxID=2934158 RepID=A0ABY4YZV0_9MICO|nr:site-specific integrase [Ornithinimicrobium sp. HY1793]USQ81975.1 site-specific integrase [Ornithinimicrobium sp. HY1793]
MKPKRKPRSVAKARLSSGISTRTNPSGVVVYRYRWDDKATGKRKVATFDTVLEAEEFRLRILNDPRQEENSATMTFAAWWDRWMEPRDLLPSTRKGYESLARNHILPALGRLRLTDIKASHLQAMHADMLQKKGLSDSHSGKALEQVGACLQDAVSDGLLSVNPRSKMPRRGRKHTGTKKDQYALSVAELVALEGAMDERWAIVVPFIAETGLRIGEVSALTVRDIDLDNGRVTVNKSRKKTGELGPPKSKAGYRAVPTLTKATAQRLRVMITDRNLTKQSPLFTGAKGGILNQDNFRGREWKDAVEAAGLDRLADGRAAPTPHTLRHTAITMWMQRAHLTPYQAAKIAGHENSLVTESIYSHLNPGELGFVRDAMEGWGRADLRAVSED